MDHTIKSYQSFASEVLNIDLPDTSTSFSLFMNNEAETPPKRIPQKPKRNKKYKNLTHEAKPSEKPKRPLLSLNPPEKLPKINRSMTTVMSKAVNTVIAANRLRPKAAKEEKKLVPINNPILIKLSSKQHPQDLQYNIKRLKNYTLLYKTEKGPLKYNISPSSQVFPKTRLLHFSSTQESSDQLLLSTENSLSEFYSQSIRLQKILHRREIDQKLDSHQYEGLLNKLFSINKNIINEQSRIARSFFSL